MFRWKPQCQVLYERVVLQARPNQPQRKLISLKTIRTRVGWVWLTKSYLHWGWLGLECETTQEATMSTKILEAGTGKQLLRMPTWEWQPCRSVCCGGCQKATLGYFALNERYWPHFLVVVFLPCTPVCSFPKHHMQGRLRRGTWIKDTVNRAQLK